jgi:pyruvate dehydrogenase E2 component (dihydrolipoamide acetyltransferase)
MESQDGLVVPSILDADRLSLAELADRRRALTEAAREGRLKPADVFSTTFTVSNLGPTGVSRFRALVLPPQAGILAVGGTSPRGTMALALSCDHRVVDGLPAAMFLRDVAERLHDPSWMLDATGSRS